MRFRRNFFRVFANMLLLFSANSTRLTKVKRSKFSSYLYRKWTTKKGRFKKFKTNEKYRNTF